MRAGYSGPTIDRLMITLFFCVETFSRGLLLAIIPLDLLEHLGNTQRVTLFYAAVAIFGLGNCILVPWLLNRLGARLIVAAAGVFMTLASILMATESIVGMAFGLVVRVFAGACIEIPLMAHMMDRIPRHRLGAFEPTRIFFQGSCIAIAPWLGFQLREYVNTGTPFLISAIGGIIMLCLALLALPGLRPESRSTAPLRPPIGTVLRFFEQPRLRLAWLLALARSSFWVIFYIYAPIFSVTSGWSPSAGAAVLSLGTASLFFVTIWGRLARNFGARRVLMSGYVLAGAGLVLTAAAAVWAPGIAPLLLLGTAFGASIIDGPGNVLFLRATRPHERPAMAGIYMTYRDMSQFAPVAVFSLILAVSQLATAFLIFAMALFSAARLSQLIHPRLR